MSRHPMLNPAKGLRGQKSHRKLQVAVARYMAESLEQRTLLSALGWSAGPSLPAPRADAAALTTGSGVLLFGGSISTGSTGSVLQLSADGSSWSAAPALNLSRASAGIGETGQPGPVIATGTDGSNYKYNSDIFLFGGSNRGTPTGSVVNYDTTGDNPVNAPAMSIARTSFAYATDSASGDVFAIGGLGSSNTALASGEFYDPSVDQWAPIAPLPQAVYGGAGASDGAGHIFVFGGDSSAGQPLDTVYRYKIATNSWDSAASLPQAVTRSSALYAAYGLIYVIGGLSASGAVANVEAYNPVTDSWSDETPLPSPVYGATATIDLNDNVQVIGGYNAAGARVTNVWTSPVGPAPVGLPVPPMLSVDTYTIYDGTPQPAQVSAVGADGYTPVGGGFDIAYNGSPIAPTAAGTYSIVAVFTSADPNYTDSAIDGTLVIGQATPQITLTGGGTFTYNGQPHTATATEVGIDGQTPVAGSLTLTYNGSASAPVNAGSYTVLANFVSADPNYASASATTTITIPDPTIPTGVKVAGASLTSIQISWNAAPIPVAGYNVYQRHVLHSPKGSGATIYFTLVASTSGGTSVTLSVPQGGGGTYAVSSVSPTGVVSARSADASGSALYAPSLYGVLTSSGAVVSSITGEVGQTVTATILAYGNQYPTFTMLSGPSNMSVDPTTGVITFLPVASDMGTVYATFQATNTIGSATETIPFQVIGLPTMQVTGGTFNFDGTTHSATAVAYAIDGITLLAGTFTFTYSPAQYPQAVSTSPYAEPGTYIVHATFTSGDPAYGSASGTGMLTILPAVPGTPGDDTITLVRDSDGTQIDWMMGNMLDRVSINDANGLLINGNGGNDTINLDYSNGNPLPNTLHLNGSFTINGLQGSAPLAGTTLDIGRSTVLINYADPSTDPLPAIQQYLQNGYAGGAWTGVATNSTGAITSNVAASDLNKTTAVGYADSVDGIVSLPANTIELKYTLYGDTGLTGSVGFTDFMRLTQHYGQTAGTTWSRGDFNYDGTVGAADVNLLSPNYGQTLPAPAATLISAVPPSSTRPSRVTIIPPPAVLSDPTTPVSAVPVMTSDSLLSGKHAGKAHSAKKRR